MKRNLQPGIAAAVAFVLVMGPVNASKVTQLSNSVTYPAKKVVKNVKHNVKQPVKSITGPVNQTGQTTTRVFHKVNQQ